MGRSDSLWLKTHVDIAAHPKVRKLARRLNVSLPTAIGHLIMLWSWCMTYAPDGSLSNHDEEDIALAAGWDEDPRKLMDALRSCRWIDNDPLRIHEWEMYGGRLLDIREMRREHGRKGGRPRLDGKPKPHAEPKAKPHAEPKAEAKKSRRDKRREDKPLPPDGGEAATAQTILKDVLESGTQYPKNFTGHLARQVKTLLDEGFPRPQVEAAARRCVQKGLSPGTLPSLLVAVKGGNVVEAVDTCSCGIPIRPRSRCVKCFPPDSEAS